MQKVANARKKANKCFPNFLENLIENLVKCKSEKCGSENKDFLT